MELTTVVCTDFLLTPLYFSSFLREMLISVALGQVLSLLVCGIGLTSKYLAEDFHANTPVFQSFLNYILLFLVYTTTLAVRQGKLSLSPGKGLLQPCRRTRALTRYHLITSNTSKMIHIPRTHSVIL